MNKKELIRKVVEANDLTKIDATASKYSFVDIRLVFGLVL